MSNLPALSECHDCHDPIRFVRMIDTGRAVPVNPQPDPALTGQHGTVAARLGRDRRLEGYVTTADRVASPLHPYRFRPHFATCETRRQEKKAPSTPAADAPLF